MVERLSSETTPSGAIVSKRTKNEKRLTENHRPRGIYCGTDIRLHHFLKESFRVLTKTIKWKNGYLLRSCHTLLYGSCGYQTSCPQNVLIAVFSICIYSALHQSSPALGFSSQEQITEQVPTGIHDRRMAGIVTDTGYVLMPKFPQH